MAEKNNNLLENNENNNENLNSEIDKKIADFEMIANKSPNEKVDEIKSLMEFVKKIDKNDLSNETNNKIKHLKDLLGDDYKEFCNKKVEIQKAEITEISQIQTLELKEQIEAEKFKGPENISKEDLTIGNILSDSQIKRINNPQNISDNALIIGVCTLETIKVALTLTKDIIIGVKNSIKHSKSLLQKTSTYNNQI